MSESDNFDDLFAPETATAENDAETSTELAPWKVLIVDDDVSIHAVLSLALQNATVEDRPLSLLDVTSSTAAKEQLQMHPDIALVLLDVVMETEQAGLDLVHYIRHELNNKRLQILLVTGQPGYAPERDMVVKYEINNYRLKSELSADKIFASVYSALRTYQILQEQDQQRQQLEASEQRYLDLYDHSPDMYVSVEAATAKVRQCNQTLANKLGYAKDEIIGEPIFKLYHPDCMPDVEQAFQSFVNTGEVHNAELQLMRKNGSKIDVSLNVSAVRDEQGKILYSRSCWNDITERKSIEAELEKYRNHLEELVEQRTAQLQAAETRYRMVADFTYDWETWLDKQGKFIYCSPSCQRVTGYSSEQFMTDSSLFLSIIIPEDRPTMQAHMQEHHHKNSKVSNFVYRIQRADGQIAWIEHVCQPVFDQAGEHLGQRASNRDVSDRHTDKVDD